MLRYTPLLKWSFVKDINSKRLLKFYVVEDRHVVWSRLSLFVTELDISGDSTPNKALEVINSTFSPLFCVNQT